jgi:putative transposase
MPAAKNINNVQQNYYFLTLSVVDWVDVFIRPAYKNIIVDTLNFFAEKKELIIYSWCLMSNHLHILAKLPETYQLPVLLREFKRISSKEIFAALDDELEPECRRGWMMQRFQSPVGVTRHIGKYHFWQDGNHPVLIKDEEPASILHQINFIHENPVRCLIVDKPESYIYSSAQDYKGKKGLVKVKPFNVLSK